MEAYNGLEMCPLNRMIGQVKCRDGAHLPNGVVSAVMAHNSGVLAPGGCK